MFLVVALDCLALMVSMRVQKRMAAMVAHCVMAVSLIYSPVMRIPTANIATVSSMAVISFMPLSRCLMMLKVLTHHPSDWMPSNNFPRKTKLSFHESFGPGFTFICKYSQRHCNSHHVGTADHQTLDHLSFTRICQFL